MSRPTPTNVVYLMHEFYRAGNSLRQTAQRFGVSHQAVRKAFERHQLPVRSMNHGLVIRHNIRTETLAMFADYQTGLSSREVGQKYHYSGGAVRKRFRAYGLRPGKG